MHIDWWTLALQTVNVLILLWLLKRFLFQPVAATIANRQEAAAKLMAEADAARAAAVAEKQKAEAETRHIAAGRADIMKTALAEAEKARTAHLAEARAEADRLRAAVEAEIDGQRKAAAAAVVDDAKSLALDIAARLFTRLPDSAKVSGFIDGIAGALKALPAQSLVAMADCASIPVRAARPLSDAEAETLRQVLADVLGRSVAITVQPDAALIAGLEIETPHAIVRNSFRNDLDRLSRELNRHDGT